MMPREHRQSFWQQQVADWGATDLSAAAFCRQRSLTYHQFPYWRQQLEQPASAGAEGMAGFTRVTQVEHTAASELTIHLPGGIDLSGWHAGNIHLLGPILRQL